MHKELLALHNCIKQLPRCHYSYIIRTGTASTNRWRSRRSAPVATRDASRAPTTYCATCASKRPRGFAPSAAVTIRISSTPLNRAERRSRDCRRNFSESCNFCPRESVGLFCATSRKRRKVRCFVLSDVKINAQSISPYLL